MKTIIWIFLIVSFVGLVIYLIQKSERTHLVIDLVPDTPETLKQIIHGAEILPQKIRISDAITGLVKPPEEPKGLSRYLQLTVE